MPQSESSATSAVTGKSAADAQTLIGLLESLVPLLLRIQSQPGQAFQPAPVEPLLQNYLLDQQAAVSFVEDLLAASLRNISTYLEANAGRYAGLEPCAGIITQATHCFAARDYSQAFGMIWHVYRIIASARAVNPQVPPTRMTELGSLSTKTSVH